MAQSLENNRSKIKTSVHGRRLGLDNDEFLVGVKGIRMVVTNATSDTTGTAIPNHGLASVVTTTNDSWTLTDPIPGVPVRLATGSTSTGTHTITCAAATIYSTNGIEGASVLMSAAGAHIELTGLTTAAWVVTSRGSTAVVSVSS
ncbi:MAG: hypothetical protein PVI03_07360 [Candidatus Thorarchaeota archaeon]|jgi:hypothetical protein